MTSFWEEYTETGAGFWDKKATSIPYKGILDMEADFFSPNPYRKSANVHKKLSMLW